MNGCGDLLTYYQSLGQERWEHRLPLLIKIRCPCTQKVHIKKELAIRGIV
jgi:hypothetical protein